MASTAWNTRFDPQECRRQSKSPLSTAEEAILLCVAFQLLANAPSRRIAFSTEMIGPPSVTSLRKQFRRRWLKCRSQHPLTAADEKSVQNGTPHPGNWNCLKNLGRVGNFPAGRCRTPRQC